MTHQLQPSAESGPSPATSPAWRWRMEDAAGAQVPGVESPEFPSQGEAETWVGEAWRELLDGGVDAVTLLEGDREVYGPMSLHAS